LLAASKSPANSIQVMFAQAPISVPEVTLSEGSAAVLGEEIGSISVRTEAYYSFILFKFGGVLEQAQRIIASSSISKLVRVYFSLQRSSPPLTLHMPLDRIHGFIDNASIILGGLLACSRSLLDIVHLQVTAMGSIASGMNHEEYCKHARIVESIRPPLAKSLPSRRFVVLVLACLK
jgi:hypothetical protein